MPETVSASHVIPPSQGWRHNIQVQNAPLLKKIPNGHGAPCSIEATKPFFRMQKTAKKSEF